MSDIEIEINGQKLTAKPNQTIIQVADEAGIYIPRFCYHKNLSVPANCRMCLVEVEKFPKAMPACATPVNNGMKVFTQSAKTIAAQRAVMEFLLVNHPLDCPICDQGGECELQDLSMGYGACSSPYEEPKRSVADQNLGPLIATEMTRCIYCTRCVRFGDEVAGVREMGAIGRGEFTEIGTYVQEAVKSEVSGNIIDICPVGALTSKPYRFTARAWEMQQAPSVAPHDCLGSNIYVHTRQGKVMRVVARENLAINRTWISDRDRFSYTALTHPDRLEHPMAKIDGKWEVISWPQALELAANQLQDALRAYGSDKVGALASPNATLEEFYLLQKIIRGLGSPHIDYRLRERDTRDQAQMGLFPGLNLPINELSTCDAILLVGSNIRKEQPIAATEIRKAALKGGAVVAINPVDYKFNFAVSAKHIVAPQHMVNNLIALAKALGVRKLERDVVVSDEIAALAQQLKDKPRACILLGALAMHHPEASQLRYIAQLIAEHIDAKLGFMTDGANAAGAWIAGAVPHRHPAGGVINHQGLNAYEMLAKPRKAYVLLNVEPDVDCANSQLAIEAMKQAKFVMALSIYKNPVLEAHAHLILPMTPFTETSGTFVNVTGMWQHFHGVAQPLASARPAWKILRVLGNYLHLTGFDYEKSEEIAHELKATLTQSAPLTTQFSTPREDMAAVAPVKLMRVGEVPLYAIDSIVRRAQPLQEAQTILDGDTAAVRVHPSTAEQLQLQAGDRVVVTQQHTATVRLPLCCDERIPVGAAWIAGGIPATVGLGDLFAEVQITKAS